MNTLIASILLLSIFFISGIEKIFSFSSTVKGFVGKTGVPINIAILAIFIAICIECFAPLLVWLKTKYSNYAVMSLIVFTILATIIYHRNDKRGALRNASLVGGLILLMQ
jgi:uncharacterized membrane protein YphA (DoxX/SURF4 family)